MVDKWCHFNDDCCDDDEDVTAKLPFCRLRIIIAMVMPMLLQKQLMCAVMIIQL